MKKFTAFLALMLLTAMAAEETAPMGARTSTEVYNLVQLYHQDTLAKISQLEDRLDAVDSHIANSTNYIVSIENMEKTWIEERTQPLYINLLNIVFTLIMFCLIGYLFSRHERRLLLKHGIIKPGALK